MSYESEWDQASLWQRWTFSVATPMINRGYKMPLQYDTLMTLPSNFFSKQNIIALEKAYATSKSMYGIPRLIIAMAKSRWFDCIIITSWAIAEGVVRIASPVVLHLLLSAMQDPSNEYESKLAYTWAGVLGVLSLAQAIIHHILFLYSMRMGWFWKISAMGMIYNKLFDIKNGSASSKFGTGQLVNFVSNDVSRFEEFAIFAVFSYVSFLELLALFLVLIFQLNVASGCSAVAISCVFIPIQMYIGKQFAKYRRLTAKATDQRVRFISEVINGISTVKSYGWERSFFKYISEFRQEELKYIAQSQILRSINLGLYFFTPSLANFATFVVYWATGGYLSLPLVFSTISLLQQLRTTMGRQWTRSIETGSEAFSAAHRIEDFLNNFTDQVMTNTTPATTVAFKSVATDDNDAGDIELTDISIAPATADESEIPLSRRTTEHSMHDRLKPILSLEKCTFTYAPITAPEIVKTGSTFSLDGINFDLFEGELLMVVGSVGSGKSTLLESILGELPVNKGRIQYSGGDGKRLRFGYCQQRPWVLSGSVRCNICVAEKVTDNDVTDRDYDFKNPVINNDSLYATAIESSSLLTDLEQWPDYDLTEIGERGVSISGGQKARISLARAVYSDASIYLLDDPLSACDAKVGKDLFFNCIVNSLKNRNKVVVLATHQLQYLPYADHILVLDQGKQVFYGKYTELVDNQAKFPSLELSSTEMITASLSRDDGTEGERELTHKYDKNWMKRKNSKGEQVDDNGNTVKKIIVDEDRVEGKLSMKLIWRYLLSGGTFMGLSALFLAVLSQAISMITDYWLKWWAVDAFFDSQRNIKYVWIFAILTFICIIIGWLRAQVFMDFNRNSASNLHDKCLWAVIHSPLTFFNSNPTGRILNRFAKDQNLVDETLPLTLFDFLENCFLFCVASLILVCVAIPYLIIVMPPMLYIFYLSREKYIQSSREIKRLEAVTRSPIYSDFSATLDGLVTLRAYNIESRFTNSFQQSLNKNSRVYWSFLMVSRWLGFRMDLKSATIVIALVFVAVILRGTIDVGLIGYAIVYTLGLSGLMQWSVRQSGETETQFTSVERIDAYASLTPEEGYTSTLHDYRAKSRKRTISFSIGAQQQQQVVVAKNSSTNSAGSLEIVNLKVKYRDYLNHVIDGLSLTIPNGCKIGVCGRTGSGKSTILLSLLRLNIITEGDIVYNNESLLGMDLETVRSIISVIPQDPTLFSGTIRFNLDPFSVYQDGEIWAALRDAHIADVIEQDGNGLSATVEENGKNFSVGQRQLLSLARAILRKCSIVLMDEVTASIDYVTDKLIQKTIRESSALKHATIITVAHRLRSIADSDLVAVLGHGKLLEVGKPLELLDQPSSHFHRLVQDSNEFADIFAIASNSSSSKNN